MHLELPSTEYERSFRAAVPLYRHDSDSTTEQYREIDLGSFDFKTYVLERLVEMTDPKPGRVACTEYWMIDERGYAGRIALRHELNEHLERFGGHIGYDVVPNRRGRGYAKQALRECLVHARELGLDRVLLTVSDTNRASRSVIEACSGALEGIDDSYDPPLRRYWIELS